MIGLKTDKERIHAILEVLMSYARLEFDPVIRISSNKDEIDALGQGVNMLGEELKASAISIKEKENMLREIHHRVKNNLQIISSLLNLQIHSDSNEQVRAFARESQSRIRAISLSHEMLYRSADFKYSNFNEYVNILMDNISSTYTLPGQNIEYEIEIPKDQMYDIDHLIPLGLIINESVSNAFKYAFPKGDGKISIVSREVGNVKSLHISDNGKGLDNNFDIELDGNLGMKLIFMLGEQADIQVDMKNEFGLSYLLKFS